MRNPINRYDPQGRRHGIWEYYWPDGTLWWRGRCSHSNHYGVWKTYRADGTLHQKEYYLRIK